ncbi:hypothetical protein PMZ80_010646 [Knufia obscura]|uniref:FAD/NAD(P)-binding domain-containing protein n=1 Tax=Knufia obscura TaxID=1635080 RepID=A0ABR0R8Z4_9EURO|nr:hypothetical protein PMZ80_010646 [Knufia obscura]
MKRSLKLCSHFPRIAGKRACSQKQHILPDSTRSFATSLRRLYADVADTKDSRERVVILGSGWAGYVVARNLDAKKYKVTVISPRTYFVFTPLLTDTAVGTLEFRNILESVRRANSDIEFVQGWADDVNFVAKTVDVEPSVLDPAQSYALIQSREGPAKENMLIPEEEKQLDKSVHLENHVPVFPVKYDKLIVTVGSYSQTFNTPGVKENAYFLKDVGDARKIRKRVLELFELCHMPFISDETKSQLLHFCVVGAGPTGMEFAGNLSDLIQQDMSRIHPQLMKFVKITLYDVAPKILPMFDAALADYASKQYARHNISIKTSHHVEELRKGPPNMKDASQRQDQIPAGRAFTLRTTEDGETGCGMCVWSTGLMNNPFVAKALSRVRRFPVESAQVTEGSPIDQSNPRQWIIQRNPKTGSIIVDDHFRIQLQTESASSEKSSETAGHAIMQDAFAIGDCANIGGLTPPLPATAQVANQQAQYLSSAFNKHYSSATSKFDPESYASSQGFNYHNRGVMTFLGSSKAVLQGPNTDRKGAGQGLKGFLAYAIWRGAYLTMTLSWRNKFLIPIQWLAVKLFGRHISRF